MSHDPEQGTAPCWRQLSDGEGAHRENIMRVLSQLIVWSALALCLAAPSADAQEYSTVPSATEQIGDVVLRDALSHYSPNYNYLARSEQIRAYANIYQAVHGTQPALTSQDSALLSQQVYVVPAEPQVYYYNPPPVYYQPSSPGFSFGFSVGNDRWNRPGWHRPRPGSRPPPHFGSGRPGRPGSPGRPGGPGRPPRPRPR